MPSSAPSRLRFLLVASFCVAFVLIVRLYFVSVVHGDEYRTAAERQYQRPLGGTFDRGAIYFTDKDGREVGAATLASGATISVNPTQIKDPAAVYTTIAAVTPIDRELFMMRASKVDDTYEEVAKRITRTQALTLKNMKVPGVTLVDERWRYYPGVRLGSHVLGFVGWKGDTQLGRYGLESYYNYVLQRGDGEVKYNFFAEIFGDIKTAVEKGSDLPGDIVVTVEPTVQSNLEKTLAEFSKEWSPEIAGGIVMDPKTGAIIALAALPDFDPNNYSSERNPGVFGNPLVESMFEMGSIMKPVTLAAGLDAGVITPETTYNDLGFLELNKEKISNFDKKGRGIVSMQEVLNQSLNTGAAYVALKLGHEKFSSYMRSFGIGEETGIDLPNEARGLTKNLDSTRDIEQATASYGQGIAVSPIMMARALATLGNGGILVNPHLIKEIRYQVGYSKYPDYTSTRRVISAKASEDITRMLVTVVDKALVHGDAKLPRYSVAAKTGTAQIANPAGGGYFEDRYLHSFFGYFPAYDPKFLVFLFTVYPKNVNYASQTLTKPFMDTTKFLLSYYDVPPDR